MATRFGWGKILLSVFDGPSAKNPYRCKDLGDISSKSQVTAHFVPNFVAMATRVVRGKFE